MDEQPFLMRSLDALAKQGVRYPGELGKLSEPALEALRAEYWDRARRQGLLPGRQLVDKNPLNMVLLPLNVSVLDPSLVNPPAPLMPLL